MGLNWRDIQDRAVTFSHNYRDAKDEDRDAKPFWKDLFALYGVDPRSVGAFEERVKIHGRPGTGKIDYFSPAKFLIEHKSRGKSLDDAYKQAMDYFDALKEGEKPRYIVVSDFEYIRVYDLVAKGKERLVKFEVKNLAKHVKKLGFLADREESEYEVETEIDVRAVRAIGKLYKALKESHYPPEHLSRLLTRLVFCFFADDTEIFERNSLRRYLDENTKADGSDIGAHLSAIFQVLDTEEANRQNTLSDTLAALPYVNGGLFKDSLPAIFGTREIRDTLIGCMEFDWSCISPAVFGSMFQSIMDEKERHDLGAHYTSEENIMKVIKGLFLDELHEEFEKAKNEEKLRALWDKVERITLLDPACGCGNFLVVAYRELRRIEIDIIKRLDKGKKGNVEKVEAGQAHLGLEMNLAHLSKMSVERMYGIELESFPAEVAKLSLWLMDHMMNMELGAYYGKPLKKLPLTEAPHITEGNALRIDWETVVPKDTLTHILGNPPYLGYKQQSAEQKEDLAIVCSGVEGTGVLDYVAGWYFQSAKFIQGTGISAAFVSTNSISQGEQVAALWRPLIENFKIHISFAHRTFKWSNEAKGKAAVYCIIVGFSLFKSNKVRIFSYENARGEPNEILATHINPYLVDGPSIFLDKRMRPISGDAPGLMYGNEPREGGMLLLDEAERANIITLYPQSERWIRRFVSADDFLNGTVRYCYWLVGAGVDILKLPPIKDRLSKVRMFREMSKQKAAHQAKDTPALFVSIRQGDSPYLLIPIVSSENRRYIPFGYVSSDIITSNANFMLPNATLWHFGILESEMHMTWVRAVCGRLESRYRYSNTIVYNNFPWPEGVSDEQKKVVESAAQAVLDVRAQFPGATLADLYDPNTMPKALLDAHRALDKAVDACYGKKPSDFPTEPARLEFLFEKYQELIKKADAKPSKKTKKVVAK